MSKNCTQKRGGRDCYMISRLRVTEIDSDNVQVKPVFQTSVRGKSFQWTGINITCMESSFGTAVFHLTRTGDPLQNCWLLLIFLL